MFYIMFILYFILYLCRYLCMWPFCKSHSAVLSCMQQWYRLRHDSGADLNKNGRAGGGAVSYLFAALLRYRCRRSVVAERL